ncbi:alpha/beta fold hydrolase [Nocardia vaccinii]|uniref:alpha/beta fold hydrolase n=1 Tax=Nocardia vaccinii TaxID=1822 RepID=UPI000834BD41|nr:alpha/beta hydrolase [Nocardia vaccinii]
MSARTEFRFEGSDGRQIVGYRWKPDSAPRAIVQVIHGVGEHLRRYEHFAQTLTAAGFFVHGYDSRGHGRSMASSAEPGVIGARGWTQSIEDIDVLVERGRAEFPDLPLVVFAHSMGSFATQQYLLQHSDRVDAVALSGTTALDLIEPALDLEAGVGLDGFNAPFEPGRTGFEWLSRDAHQVDLYVQDPLCGFAYDTEGMKAVFAGARRAAEPERLAAIRSDLPIYIAVGDQDPVNGQLTLVDALVDRYRAAGLTDVELRTYPGARHEILNETNRDEVERDLVAWFDRVTA